MYTLIFDTTAASCSIVLCNDGKVIDCYDKIFDFGQAEVLIPEIKNMLLRNKLAFSEIEGTFVCVGPGSFTGVRIGVTMVETFAMVEDKQCVGVDSLYAAALFHSLENVLTKEVSSFLITHPVSLICSIFAL